MKLCGERTKKKGGKKQNIFYVLVSLTLMAALCTIGIILTSFIKQSLEMLFN